MLVENVIKCFRNNYIASNLAFWTQCLIAIGDYQELRDKWSCYYELQYHWKIYYT